MKNKITYQERKANEEFFEQMIATTPMYGWKEMGLTFACHNGLLYGFRKDLLKVAEITTKPFRKKMRAIQPNKTYPGVLGAKIEQLKETYAQNAHDMITGRVSESSSKTKVIESTNGNISDDNLSETALHGDLVLCMKQGDEWNDLHDTLKKAAKSKIFMLVMPKEWTKHLDCEYDVVAEGEEVFVEGPPIREDHHPFYLKHEAVIVTSKGVKEMMQE